MSVAPSQPLHFDLDLKPTAALYFAVGLEAGAVIALQICIMRIFSVGSWAHFGSLVVSLAMLGFGLTSAVMCISKDWFDRHWQGVAMASLLLFGPLTVAANLLAQQIPFNAIFLVSDPMQKWRLAGNFMLYMLPFLAGALYLGTVFLKANKIFSRVYFADLTGAGLCGLAFLVAMYLSPPENLIVVPLLLWFDRQPVLVLGARRPARRDLASRRWRRRRSPPTLRCRRCSASPSSPCPTTRAWPMRANFPTPRGSTRARRRSDISRSIPARICTSRRGSPTTRRSTCRRCRRTPTSACISTARGRAASSATCRRSRPSITASCRWSIPIWSSRTPTPSSCSSAAASRPRWRCR